MELFEIKFVPLSEPLYNRFLTLTAGYVFALLAFGFPLSFPFTLYLLFFTPYWWPTLIYLYFCYTDINILQNRRQALSMGAKLRLLEALHKLFSRKNPLNNKHGTQQFNPCKNYLLASYPHGILPTGIVTCLGTCGTNWQQLFPYHETSFSTINAHYCAPFFRELMLGMGGISSDASAITYVLNKPQGDGHIVVLMPGGAEEAFYCNPSEYKIVLKKRKGFVRLALKTGASLVPVYTFGESSLFRQSKNKYLVGYLKWMRKITGVAMISPIGRGLFQYSFGLIQVPLDVVVGDPIEVKKNENPTLEEINELHQKYIDALLKLFEQEKHKYVENAESVLRLNWSHSIKLFDGL